MERIKYNTLANDQLKAKLYEIAPENKIKFFKKPVMSTSLTKFLDWPDTVQIISSKKMGLVSV